VIYDAIQMGIPLSRIHEITKIDMWFLNQYEELHLLEKEISTYTIQSLTKDLILEAKQKGFADRQIAHMLGCYESEVYNKRDE
jgi:carbamoyl-phosphate synthase large subunit